MVAIVNCILNGILPSGGPTRTPRIDVDDFERFWAQDTQNLPAGGPRPAPHTKYDFRNINNRFTECIGSSTNRAAMHGLDAFLNGVKGRLLYLDQDGGRRNPVSPRKMEEYIRRAIRTGGGEEEFLQPMRAVSTPPFFFLHLTLHDRVRYPNGQEREMKMKMKIKK
jgi:hypothetical protein